MVNQNMNFLWQVTSIFFFCITCMTTSTGEETLNQSWLACLYLSHFALFKMNSTCFNTIIHNALACIQYSIIASGLFFDFKIKCFLKKMNRSYKSWTQSCLLVTLLDCKLMFKYRSDFTLIQEWYDFKDKCDAKSIKYHNVHSFH